MRKDVNVGDLVLLTKVSSKRLRKPVVVAVTALGEDMFEVSGYDTVGVYYDMAVDEWTRVGRVPKVGDKMEAVRNAGYVYDTPKPFTVRHVDADGDVFSEEDEVGGFDMFLVEYKGSDGDIIRFSDDDTPAIVARTSTEDIPQSVREYVDAILADTDAVDEKPTNIDVDITEKELDFKPKADVVNHPSHYNSGKFETIEMIEEVTKNYEDGYVAHCVGTAIKYISRAPFKHATPNEDIKKAAKYLEFATKYLSDKEAADV